MLFEFDNTGEEEDWQIFCKREFLFWKLVLVPWIDEDELLDIPWQLILRVFADSLVDSGAVECE